LPGQQVGHQGERLDFGCPGAPPNEDAAVIEIERPLNRTAAERLIKEIGPTAAPSLRWCEKFRCWPRKIIWGESLTVDGRKI